mmetsp:Transcript_74158/g.176663  ORF Transcript_74158/g.176663 Transcript_74158/m.176663 type:complete len:214 (+) Transcript_74158:1219-1860(+)
MCLAETLEPLALAEEPLLLGAQLGLVHVIIDVLLTAIDDAMEPKRQPDIRLAHHHDLLHYIGSLSSLCVIALGDNTQRATSLWIILGCEFDHLRVAEIRHGWDHAADNNLLRLDVLLNQAHGDLVDVLHLLRVVSDTGQIDEGELRPSATDNLHVDRPVHNELVPRLSFCQGPNLLLDIANLAFDPVNKAWIHGHLCIRLLKPGLSEQSQHAR